MTADQRTYDSAYSDDIRLVGEAAMYQILLSSDRVTRVERYSTMLQQHVGDVVFAFGKSEEDETHIRRS